MKWIVFGLLAGFLPVLFYLGMAMGLFPLVVILLLPMKDPRMLLFTIVHVVIYGSLFYVIAVGLARLISKLEVRLRAIALAAVFATITWITLQPLYGWGGYATSTYKNLFELLLADF